MVIRRFGYRSEMENAHWRYSSGIFFGLTISPDEYALKRVISGYHSKLNSPNRERKKTKTK